eukprot:7284233-Alexandrium_andersonii.AAC.1
MEQPGSHTTANRNHHSSTRSLTVNSGKHTPASNNLTEFGCASSWKPCSTQVQWLCRFGERPRVQDYTATAVYTHGAPAPTDSASAVA